jgi:hypothetical protein
MAVGDLPFCPDFAGRPIVAVPHVFQAMLPVSDSKPVRGGAAVPWLKLDKALRWTDSM